jgi:hypothetical protein
MDEHLLEQINQYRASAQEFGEAALAAMSQGDIGLARTASRQAAQYARIVIQLESGEKQVAPAEPEPTVREPEEETGAAATVSFD